MKITKDDIYTNLIYDKPVVYNEQITLYPVKMKDVMIFNQCTPSITIRKNSYFGEINILKMFYFEFIKYARGNTELAELHKMPIITIAYDLFLNLLVLVCDEKADIEYNTETLDVSINGCLITDEIFDDLRRIIILQNDIDFDIDEFINAETLRAFEREREFRNKKNKNDADMEDYIDSMVIALGVTNEYVENLTIRKFWRYIKRITKQEDYIACHNGEMTGFVSFKKPIQYWMTSLDKEDKYADYKTSEKELREKIG